MENGWCDRDRPFPRCGGSRRPASRVRSTRWLHRTHHRVVTVTHWGRTGRDRTAKGLHGRAHVGCRSDGSADAPRLELLLTGKGFRELEGDGGTSTLDLDYYEVPVLVGLQLSPGSSFSSELYAGPWISKERSCTASLTEGSVALSFDCNEVPDDPILRKTTDRGIAAGFAISFDTVGSFRALLDARYTAGLRNIDDAPAVDNVNARHRGYAVSAGISLPVGS